ncbi:hypothetical protein pdam_00000185 [Pocillopora damicornis]|uniref:Uncharacterized protein n=1 Tax=Pocillopora damicornis TaxID=46731 RepID=A0A3M6UWT5_POCDA|nr:hypothetical protein pdam_00000185 [Pocillopora damicornis]
MALMTEYMRTLKFNRSVMLVDKQKIQTNSSKIRTRVRVTTCRYLVPISKARSLSTLIAHTVMRDTPHNKYVGKCPSVRKR